MLRGSIECSLRWLQTGCLRLSEAPIGRSPRQLASRAAKEACCTSTLEFSGDKRGRLREVLANIVRRIPLLLIVVLYVSVPGLRNGTTTEVQVDLQEEHYASNQRESHCQIPPVSSRWKTGYQSRSLSHSVRPQPQTSPPRQAFSKSPCISGGQWWDGW